MPENAHIIVSYRIGNLSQRCITLVFTTRFDKVCLFVSLIKVQSLIPESIAKGSRL